MLSQTDAYSEYDKESHTRLKYSNVEAVTKRAALIDGNWIPLSQTKSDGDGNVYIANWLWEKLRCGEA